MRKENSLMLHFSRRKTKAHSLFEFIGREDVYLESETVSLSPFCSNRKLEEIYKDTDSLKLDIISENDVFDETLPHLSHKRLKKDEHMVSKIKEEPFGLRKQETILISESPEKVIDLTQSSPEKYKCISDSSDEEPVKGKRIRKNSTSSSEGEMCEDHVQCTDELPWDIDGNCSVKVKYDKSEGQRMKSTKDGRQWSRYNNSYTKLFPKRKGLRLRSTCKGSFQCLNKKCPFTELYNKPNSVHIIKCDGYSVCEECHYRMMQIPCPAVKIWEFPQNSEYVTVCHHGNHTCFATKKTKIPTEKLKQAMELGPSKKPCEITNRLIMNTIEKSKSRYEVEAITESLADTRKVRNLKQQFTQSESLAEKLSNLQDKCLNQYSDPYLLYEYQVKEQRANKWIVTHSTIKDNSIVKTVTETTSPDDYQTYIIKSSRSKLETMLHMMNADHFLSEEWAFMNFNNQTFGSKARFQQRKA